MSLHGSISGPTPWHVSAEACVSVLWWDACLPVDISFGTNTRADLPPIDPWLGHHVLSDPANEVTGLQTAIHDPANWSGSFPAGAHPVVTLTDAVTRAKPPIDPVGQARLPPEGPSAQHRAHEVRHLPTRRKYRLSAKVGGRRRYATTAPACTDGGLHRSLRSRAVQRSMGDAEKLSSQPYQSFDAGFTISPDAVRQEMFHHTASPTIPSSSTTNRIARCCSPISA